MQNLTFLTTLAVGLLVAVVVAVNIAVDFEEPTVEDDSESHFTAAEGTWKVIWGFGSMLILFRINSSL